MESAAPTPTKQNSVMHGRTLIEWDDHEVVAFQASQKYVEVVLRESEKRPIISQPLKELLVDSRYEQFVQVHRSVLLRLSDLVEVRREPEGHGYWAHVAGGHVLPISRRYGAELRRLLRLRPVADEGLTPAS